MSLTQSATAAVPQSEMDRILDDLEKSIATLDDAKDTLKRRLEPVLHEDYPEPPSPEAKTCDPEYTPIARRLKILTGRVDSINAQFSKVYQRLGI